MKNVYERINELLGTDYKSDTEINFKLMSIYARLPEDFIREYKDNVNWFLISEFQNLSEGLIREFRDKVDWFRISEYQKLSEDFIKEFKDIVDWVNISKYQKLSEDFIRGFKSEVDWVNISKYQKLSEDFIREYKDNVNWVNISKYQKLSKGFIYEFQKQLYKYTYLGSIDDNWIYKDVEFKKRQVVETGFYECYDDYFIAYKGIRSDRYSYYNFQYRYEPGNTYESWCDCSNEDNSFGLSVWTEDKARGYCNEMVIKVKVKYEDVGRVVHNGGKVRCFKIEVLD